LSISQNYVTGGGADPWSTAQSFDANFDLRYADGRDEFLNLYQKGKDLQWDSLTRIDWSESLDPDNPMQMPDEFDGLYHTRYWNGFSDRFRGEVRRHNQAWTISQFLHGEQAALLCAAKIVQQAPDLDAKFYASTQVMDEARHVEAYKKLLSRFELAYPPTSPLQALIDQALQDKRWDMTYLAMQVVIEGLALASFSNIRNHAGSRLVRQIHAFVMQDEARHVFFGRVSLRDFYPQLSDQERKEREDFLIEACHVMRDRLVQREVYENLGLPADECIAAQYERGFMQAFRIQLFQRIVPVVRDIGLWSPKIQSAFDAMGVLGYASIDPAELGRDDERVAQQTGDARDERVDYVNRMIRDGASAA
jgi:hypothetical protein